MYAGGRAHGLRQPCQAILRNVESARLDAVISAEVVQEILHRFSALREPRLGAEMARAAIDLFAPVVPVTYDVMRRMPDLVERYPDLSARDLVHVATCLEEGIGAIVSPDRGFDSVSGLARVDPDDANGLEPHLR